MSEIICVMCVYNEELNLQQCISHLEPYVDKIVIVGDGSTDNTVAIAKSNKKVVEVVVNTDNKGPDRKWRERYNRETVIKTALKNADSTNPWVLCIDPDERFEKRFLKKLRSITKKYDNSSKVLTIKFRELWDGIKQFRVDGVWDTKEKGLLFQLQSEMTFNYDQEYHIPWAYREIVANREFLDYNCYHLKMVKSIDRVERKELYNRLDPNKEMQKIGYDYLCDTDGIKIMKVSYRRRYDYNSIPSYYK